MVMFLVYAPYNIPLPVKQATHKVSHACIITGHFYGQ